MTEDVKKLEILFQNLIERVRFDKDSEELELPGVITSEEYRALRYAEAVILGIEFEDDVEEEEQHEEVESLSTDDTESEEDHSSESSGISQIVSEGIETLLDCSALNAAEVYSHIKLGLDFGTAYSKACLIETEDDEERVHDLRLGVYAGEDSMEMPVHSSLFIDPDGRLYFGPIAVEKSLEARDQGYDGLRIDSIKSFLIEENRVTLEDTPLQEVYNPSGVDISKTALLAFYLGYLLHLVRQAMHEDHDLDLTTVTRRISLPCYEAHHREKVIEELQRLFVYGDVLGKSFHDEWEDGFRVEDVVYLYEWMKENINENATNIECFLEEPLAVAGSRLGLHDKSLGNVTLVMDVGAGTTDFVMFQVYANVETGLKNAKEVKGSVYGVPTAGDKLDNILLRYILETAGINRGSEKYKEIIASLRLDIRDYKEQLFEKHSLRYSLPGDITGELYLNEFMKYPPVKDFKKQLKNAITHVLKTVHSSWIRKKILQENQEHKLPVILTGGGASLPMVKALCNSVIDVDGFQVPLTLSPTVPTWIEDTYEGEILELYPQMAVSIGGAKEFILDSRTVQNEYH